MGGVGGAGSVGDVGGVGRWVDRERFGNKILFIDLQFVGLGPSL